MTISTKIEQATAPSRELDYDDEDCANCGGEGFTYGCSWDWQCDTYDEGEGTCLCTRRCEWCNPPKLTDAEKRERDELCQILADALSDRCTRCHGERVLYRQDCGAHGLTVPCPSCGGDSKQGTQHD